MVMACYRRYTKHHKTIVLRLSRRTKNQKKKISTNSNLILPFTFRKCALLYTHTHTQKIAQVNVGTKFILYLCLYQLKSHTVLFFQCNRIRFLVYLYVSIRICRLNLQLLTRPNEHIDKIKWNLRFFSLYLSLYKYITRTALFEMFAFRWCNAKRDNVPHNCFSLRVWIL